VEQQFFIKGSSLKGHGNSKDPNQDLYFIDKFVYQGETIEYFGVFDGHGKLGKEASNTAKAMLYSSIKDAFSFDFENFQKSV
jgi:serine/threonine protein phosphatase PrpC